MQTEINIRPAVMSDAVGIEAVARRTWSSTYADVIPPEIQSRLLGSYYSPAALQAAIAQERSGFFVATMQESIIGYAQFYLREGEIRSGELLRIYVLPEWQRAGVGGRLLAKGLSYLAQQGTSHLFVTVEKNNFIGRGFYEKKGFYQVRDFSIELAGYPLAVVEYRLDLTKPAG